MEQMNLFECLYETYKITKPIRLIELFAGYGSQALALKYLGANFEHYKICEWAIPSIIAYADLHRNELSEYGNDYCSDLTKEQIANELYSMGVSVDYNKPATVDNLKRMKEDKLRLCYNSIKWCNNLVDISRIKGKDLHIEDTEKFTYLLTYSFPCQDLSLAGKGAGMEKGSGTRSGLLWEVERILSECKNKPQVLLMENVPQVHGQGNLEHFKQWQLRLEEFGYQNYWEDLSAIEFGIPQTRNRTFMVSILGNYNYRFPVKSKLNLRLKDLLENNVDEKYYLSDKMIDYISATGTKNFSNGDSKINREIARPLTTEQNKRGGTTNYIGDDLVEEGDVVKHSYTQQILNGNKKCVEKNDGCMITLTTRGDCVGVVVKEENKPILIGGVGEKKSNNGTRWYQQDRIYKDNVAISVTTSFNPNYKVGLRIRKLTPKECYRLMGLKNTDIALISEHQTDASNYHLAGDSIVTTCLMAIFGEMLDINWYDKFNEKEWWNNGNKCNL